MFFYKLRFILSYLIILTLIYSCSPRISRHGNFFSQDDIKLLQSTKLNKSEILEILGQPSTRSTFSDNVWYYIFFIQKERAYFKVRNTSNTVLKIKFDNKQNVKSYNIIQNKNSIKIPINNDTTETSAFKRGLVREFLDSFVRRLESKD
ncbi:MAG: hypothetical protein CFH34_01707 [Alphaproteobacteria bacterium MarineAlpha9_Bin4]|nr:hypothetical protein [Pelagibacterales bacterium]PPR24729.1 MAG: hypothetical protein CFH34_01707 [Alphaproteobacteria bacterium MarineAlpha9_Bin4]